MPEWTNNPPKAPGWYWHRESGDDEARPIHLKLENGNADWDPNGWWTIWWWPIPITPPYALPEEDPHGV